MEILKKLVVPMNNGKKDILFGIGLPEDAEQSYHLRYKIYSKYKYLNESLFDQEKEFDSHDTDGSSVHFLAKVDDRIIAFVRLIQAGTLPVEENYDFTLPKNLSAKPTTSTRAELGRLVIDRYSDTEHFPRNLILLFLINILVEYCQKRDVQFVFAFIKQRLGDKLTKLGVPYTTLEPYKLLYPKLGPMAPYFYNKDDPAFPVLFQLQDMIDFVDKNLSNNWLFHREGNVFELRTNLYTRFLKTVKAI